MAQVLIDSGPISATYPLRDVPREKWRDLMLARRSFLEITLSADCRCLVEFCNDAKEMHAVCGFASPEDMIRDGYGLEPEEISVAVEWLKLNPPAEPIALEQAVTLGKRGEFGRSRPKDRVGNTKAISEGGSTRTYILARLERDGRHDLAAKVRAGELSANAAAIMVGYRKAFTPFAHVFKQLPKLSSDQLDMVIAECISLRQKDAA